MASFNCYSNNDYIYIDKSHVFLDSDSLELYVYFDGYFNQPIDNFKEILYKLKSDHYTSKPDEYFNYQHTLFSEFADTNEYDCIYGQNKITGLNDLDNLDNLDDKFKHHNNYNEIKPNTFNHHLYNTFQFSNEYYTPYMGYSRIDADCIKKINNYKYINKYYDSSYKHHIDQTKKLVEKYFSNITKIYFGYEFNKPIENLPDSINWLVLGKSFNQSIDKYPSGLKYLTFGYDFNQPVYHLPNLLERIVFGEKFDRPIDNLPDTITHLSFNINFYHSSDYYKFGLNKINEHQPSGGIIHKSNFSGTLKKLPKNLTYLVIDDCRNFIGLENIIGNTKITHIQANYLSDKFLLNLPDTLEHLSANGYPYEPKINKLPSGLKFLNINFRNCSELIKHLPSNLEILIIPGEKYYNKDESREMKYPYNLSNLPSSLKYLKIIDDNPNNYFDLDYLPSSLTHLTLSIKSKLSLDNLPSSITHLWINTNGKELFYPQNNIKELYCTKEYVQKNINFIDKNICIKYYIN